MLNKQEKAERAEMQATIGRLNGMLSEIRYQRDQAQMRAAQLAAELALKPAPGLSTAQPGLARSLQEPGRKTARRTVRKKPAGRPAPQSRKKGR